VLSMETRETKGMEIARAKMVQPTKDGWLVKSQSSEGSYKVNEGLICSCPDCQTRNVVCKHGYAVRYYLQVEKETAHGTETEKVRITHTQAWTAYNQAQTAEVRLFDELLKDLVQGMEEPPKGFGRPKLSLRETAFCSIQKVYSQLSSRRAVSLFGNAVEKGQIGYKPHFNAVSKLLNRAELTPILHELLAISASPLKSVESDFAIDSSGFRTSSFNVYAQQKYHLKREHKWLKAHVCTGVKTNVVTSVEITDENGADSPQLKPLVMANAEAGFNMKELSADKAYSSRDNYEVVKSVGGQAFIPFRSNATGKAKGSYLWTKMFHYFQYNKEEFLAHYHKRSNVESTFAAIKKKFGETLKSKNRVAQENELLCKLIAYNLTVVIHEMFELGISGKFNSKVGISQ
jgi:transposase